MTQVAYRANLSAKSFPFISDNFGQTVIIPGPDNTFNRQVSSDQDSDKDVGIPQIYYCHNVAPHAQGFQSVGYSQVIPGTGSLTFTRIYNIRDEDGYDTYMGITSGGDFYVYTGATSPATPTAWYKKGTYPANMLVTTAYVSGTTYIYIAGYGCIRFNFGTNAFVPVVLTGLVVADILGVVGAAGYLVAWTKNYVSWSSTIDPTDFVPSLITGAGGLAVSDLKGTITVCAAHTQGFIVYATKNAVAAIYSGNARYPFNFRPISNSGGLSSPALLGVDTNTGNHYAYTTSGLQQVNTTSAAIIYPEITDFVAGKQFEDFDETTNTFVRTFLSTTMQKRLSVIGGRYLVISYGINSLTHAILYDIAQKRYGKFKIPHVDTFEYTFPSVAVTEIPRQSVGFLQNDGTVKVVDFSVNGVTSNGVLFLGKYQYARSRLLTLDEIDVENVQTGATFELLVFYSLDGKNTAIYTPTLLLEAGRFRKFGAAVTGKNHSLCFKGRWHVQSLELAFHINGKC